MNGPRELSRTEFDQRNLRYGGDLWDEDQIWRRCFSDKRVKRARYSFMGTGLWVEVEVEIDGKWETAMAYDGRPDLVFKEKRIS